MEWKVHKMEGEYIKALDVRVKLGQIGYPEMKKTGINKTEFLGGYILFLMCLLGDLPRDIIGCYPQMSSVHPDCWLNTLM